MTGTSELGDALSAALNSFLEQEESYDNRAGVFNEIVSKFAAHNPVASQVKDMFDAVLWEIIAPKHAVFWGDRLLSLDKAAGFLENPSFLRSYETIRGSHIYDAYDSPHTIAWRLHTLVWAAQTAITKDGDFVECGVFKGDMSWVVMQMPDEALNDRTFYLYDSFLGMSPSQADPQEYPDNPNFLKFANKIYSDPNVYDAVLARFGPRPNVKIVRGFLPESFGWRSRNVSPTCISI